MRSIGEGGDYVEAEDSPVSDDDVLPDLDTLRSVRLRTLFIYIYRFIYIYIYVCIYIIYIIYIYKAPDSPVSDDDVLPDLDTLRPVRCLSSSLLLSSLELRDTQSLCALNTSPPWNRQVPN